MALNCVHTPRRDTDIGSGKASNKLLVGSKEPANSRDRGQSRNPGVNFRNGMTKYLVSSNPDNPDNISVIIWP
jgi:hypothetical protein